MDDGTRAHFESLKLQGEELRRARRGLAEKDFAEARELAESKNMRLNQHTVGVHFCLKPSDPVPGKDWTINIYPTTQRLWVDPKLAKPPRDPSWRRPSGDWMPSDIVKAVLTQETASD